MKMPISAPWILTASFSLLAATGAPTFASDHSAQAEYHVPVTVDLDAYSHFPIEADYTARGDQVVLNYVLPQELTGSSKTVIRLEGGDYHSKSIVLRGPNGEANCFRGQRSMKCSVRMSQLVIDEQARDQFLRDNASSPQELKARRRVANLFSGDPIGIVTYYF